MLWTVSLPKVPKPTSTASSSRPVRCFSVRVREAEGDNADKAGFQSKELIVKAGLTLGDVDQYPELDVTIDGADE